ncbi:uncharacterized protein LOC144493024 [Mustelus asterias]
MSLAEWLLLGFLFVASLLYRDGSLLSLLSLLLPLPLWWCLGQGSEQSWDEQDLGPDPHKQQLPAREAEVNQPNNNLDTADGKVRNLIVLRPSSSPLYQSLRKVFECGYSQYGLLWYNPPEPREDQPLHQVLLDEFNLAVDHAVGKLRQLDITRIELGLIQILTVHVQAVKKEKREKVFQTRHEEVYFLRKISEALIYNLLPDSLWNLNCYRHVLKEVVALKVLEEVINTVCDADFINQALIRFLDEDLPETKKVEVVPEAPLKTGTNEEIRKESKIPKEIKKKKKKSKKKVPNIFNIFKKKKKNPKTKPMLDDHEDEVDGQLVPEFRNVDDSFRSLSPDNQAVDSAEEEDLNSSSEMPEWIKEDILLSPESERSSLRNCKITVSEISWGEIEDPSCKIDIESLEAAEDCWSIERKYHEFEDLQKELSKTVSSLVEIKLPSEIITSSDKISDELKEDVKSQLNEFLEKLVSEESTLSNESTLNFFSANDQIREYWGLLTSLFAEEDEETDADSDASEDPYDTDVGETEPVEKNPEIRETPNRHSAELKPSETINENEESDCDFRSLPDSPETKGAARNSRRKRKRSQKKVESITEETECIASQIHKLLTELLCTEYFKYKLLLCALKMLQRVKRKKLQKKLDQFFSEEQIIVYIDRVRESLWPNGKPAEPPPERSNEEKTSAKERAEELLQRKISDAIGFVLINVKELVKVWFPMFQDAEMNKRLAYEVLVFLLFEINPGIKKSWIGDPLPCLERLNAD